MQNQDKFGQTSKLENKRATNGRSANNSFSKLHLLIKLVVSYWRTLNPYFENMVSIWHANQVFSLVL